MPVRTLPASMFLSSVRTWLLFRKLRSRTRSTRKRFSLLFPLQQEVPRNTERHRQFVAKKVIQPNERRQAAYGQRDQRPADKHARLFIHNTQPETFKHRVDAP